MEKDGAAAEKRKAEMEAKIEHIRRVAVQYALNGGRVVRLPDAGKINAEESKKIIRQVVSVQYCE